MRRWHNGPMTKCQGRNIEGERCEGWACWGSYRHRFCYYHDPSGGLAERSYSLPPRVRPAPLSEAQMLDWFRRAERL